MSTYQMQRLLALDHWSPLTYHIVITPTYNIWSDQSDYRSDVFSREISGYVLNDQNDWKTIQNKLREYTILGLVLDSDIICKIWFQRNYLYKQGLVTSTKTVSVVPDYLYTTNNLKIEKNNTRTYK